MAGGRAQVDVAELLARERPKLRTPPWRRKSVEAPGSANSLKYCGEWPSNCVLVLMGFFWDSAASRVKTLKVEPACIVAWVAVLNWSFL